MKAPLEKVQKCMLFSERKDANLSLLVLDRKRMP